ncbi:MAG: rhamnan synthesis F family protein [Pseudomonadota bacterium]
MQQVFFHLPGKPGHRFFDRLQWNIAPLVTVLQKGGVPARVLGYHPKDPGAVFVQDSWHIWVCNETLPPPGGLGHHALWFCHRMQYPPLTQLREYDAVLTTSRAHANFLRRVLAGDLPIRHLPWPMRPQISGGGKAHAGKSKSEAPLWTAIWSPARGQKLEQAAAVLLNPYVAPYVSLWGSGWHRWADPDPSQGPAPVGDQVIDVLAQTSAFWSVDLLRNRMAGFLDPFVLYALQQGCRVYSDDRIGLPAALKGAVTMTDGDISHRVLDIIRDPIPLTRNQKDRITGYFQARHDPAQLADALVGLADQIQQRNRKRPSKPMVSLADGAPQIVFQDPVEQAHWAPVDPDGDLLVALERGHQPIHYVPAMLSRSSVSDLADDQLLAQSHERLRRAATVLALQRQGWPVSVLSADQVPGLVALRRGYAPLPIHDLTALLADVDAAVGAGHIPPALWQNLQDTLQLTALYKPNAQKMITVFEHPWGNVQAQTINPKDQIKYVSARLNGFDPSVPLNGISLYRRHLWKPDRSKDRADLHPLGTVGVFIHAYYDGSLMPILRRLAHLPVPASLYISTDTEAKRRVLRDTLVQAGFAFAEIRVFENRGRDIYPKFFGFSDVYARHDLVLHLHTKRSVHSPDLKDWATICFDALLGDANRIRRILTSFLYRPQQAMVSPAPIVPIYPALQWMRNLRSAEMLAPALGLSLPVAQQPFLFPAGSMFWARRSVLQPLIDLNLRPQDFPTEQGQEDGTLAHAIERLLGVLACQGDNQLRFIPDKNGAYQRPKSGG